MSTTSLYEHRARQERWQHHSAKEREALEDLALAIKRYLAQVSPGNINNAAFVDYALPHASPRAMACSMRAQNFSFMRISRSRVYSPTTSSPGWTGAALL